MKKSNTAYIYTLADPRTGEILYVGKTFDLVQRMYGHLHFRKYRSRTKNSCWIQGLKELGLKPIMEIIEEFPADSESEWSESERFWIQTFRFYGFNLNNLDSGGMGGRRSSAETKAKIGAFSRKRIHTEETKRKIGIASKSRMTELEKQNLRIKCSKPMHTEAFKQKLSKDRAGKPRPSHVRAALLAGSIRWREEQRRVKDQQSV